MIFIPGNIPSLKNSKVKTARGIFSSPTVNKFLRSIGIQKFNSRKKEVKGYVDPTRPNQFEALREEFMKMKEIVQDLMTAHDFIEDDNVKHVFPVPMSIDGQLIDPNNPRAFPLYSVDKENPGVYIKLF